jgi:hypothetical protein
LRSAQGQPAPSNLSNGDYEVHTIGVNWPHHIFVNQDFKVIGADD